MTLTHTDAGVHKLLFEGYSYSLFKPRLTKERRDLREACALTLGLGGVPAFIFTLDVVEAASRPTLPAPRTRLVVQSTALPPSKVRTLGIVDHIRGGRTSPRTLGSVEFVVK